MRFIKSFYKLFESITNIVNNYWNITFNHGINHDLDDKLKSRVGITEKEFELFLNSVLLTCKNEKLTGNWVFVSMKKQIKIVSNINYLKKRFYIVTILGKNHKTKPQKNIKLI